MDIRLQTYGNSIMIFVDERPPIIIPEELEPCGSVENPYGTAACIIECAASLVREVEENRCGS